MTTASKLLTTAEAAAHIGVKPNTLERWRTYGTGPEFIKIKPTMEIPRLCPGGSRSLTFTDVHR